MAPIKHAVARVMRSLVMKFTLLAGAMLVAAVAVMTALDYRSTQIDTRDNTREHAELLASFFAFNVALDLQSGRPEHLQQRVESIQSREEVLSVYVTDTLRRVVASSQAADYAVGERAAEPLVAAAVGAADYRSEVVDQHIHVAAPVFLDGRVIGAVFLDVPASAIGRSPQEILHRQLALAIIALAVFLPLAAFLVRRALAPINQLTEAARLASSRKLDLRIDVNTGDELEVLANAFNRMFSRLDASMKRIHRLAYVDMVTELPNRERFRKELERVARETAEAEGVGAVLFLDLDRFKRVNDSLGMGEGDRLLEAVARRLRETTRGWDLSYGESGVEPSMVARLGGDEFTLLMPRLRDPADAGRIARRIVDAVRRPFDISGHQVFLGASVGISVFPRDGGDPETLLRHADLAMAQAKRNGGNSYEFFDSAMNQSAFERLVLENELREAVSNDQLVVYYQPKVRMADGGVAGCEALVRWRHPTAGLLSPGAFIQAAEECGLIGEIGDWVMRRACHEIAGLHAQGLEVPVAVNVSAMQFESDGFADTVLDALQETGLPPHLLELELTESVAMRDPERMLDQIRPLRERGVGFAIDDFGTGHSSLAYLTRMPFDVFKIDQSFVRNMDEDEHARIVVETILTLAQSLKLKTVAEGVETTEQLARLKSLGCSLAQGYLFGRPMPFDDLVRFVKPGSLEEAARLAAG